MYVFAGQSNMVGYSAVSAQLPAVDASLSAPVRSVRFWGPLDDYAGRWTTLQAPTEISQPAYHSGFGPELSAAAALAAKHPTATIAVVKLAHNGTSLAFDWRPRTVVGLYRQLIDRVVQARASMEAQLHRRVEIAGFFWMQGETDAMWKAMANDYAGNLAAFITSVRADLASPDMPFVIGRIADLKRINRAFRYSDVVRDAQLEVASTVPQTYLASTDGLERDPSSPAHYDTRGTVDLGRRFVSRVFPL
jgi:hypothetical protein